MSRRSPVCHVGVAFYTAPNSPTQWTLVLSESPSFEGYVWCGTTAETVNGFRTSWTMCNSSLKSTNPMAMFLGIIHIAQSTMSISSTKSLLENAASQMNRPMSFCPNGSESYVVLTLLHLYNEGFVSLNDQNRKPQGLSGSIQTRLSDLHRALPQAGRAYSIVSL
jgi:hypothetical protein